MLCVIAAIILLINDTTGFTYYYNQKSKIEQVKALNEIVSNKSTPAIIKQKSLELEGAILNHRTAPEISQQFVAEFYRNARNYLATKNTAPIAKAPQASPTTPKQANPLEQRDNFMWLMASSGIIVVLGIIMIPVCLVIGFKQGWGSAIAGLILFEILFGIVAAFFYFVFGLIPMINGAWTLSYVTALLLQVVSLTLVGYLISSSSKT